MLATFAILAPALLTTALLAALFVAANRPSGLRLDVKDGSLVVRISGTDALFALCRTIDVSLELVKGVAVAPRRLVPQTGLRLPGTGISGVLRAGSYGTGSSRDFWLVRRAEEVLVFELETGAPYRRLVLEVPDANAEAVRLRPMVGAYTGTFARL